MKNKKMHIIFIAVQMAVIAIYLAFMLHFGEDSLMDFLFPYFIALNLIADITPFMKTGTVCAGERKMRILLSAFAVAAVLIPGICILYQRLKSGAVPASPKILWRSLPLIVFQIYAISSLIVMRIFKSK